MLSSGRRAPPAQAAPPPAPAQPDQLIERLRFLAEATTVLASSLDYQTTLANVARLAVPRLAQWCAVYVVADDGDVRRLAGAHVDPAKERLLRELARRYPLSDDPAHPVRQAIRSGRTVVTEPVAADQVARFAVDDGHAAILRQLDTRSAVVVPLVARGKSIGALSFGRSGDAPRDPADVSLAEEVAARCAVALENALLYREARQLAAERQSVLGQVAEGVVLADCDGLVTFVNAAAARMLGTDRTGVTVEERPTAYGLWTPDGRPYAADELPLTRAVRHRETVTAVEVVIRRSDQSDVHVRASAAPVIGDDGACLGGVLTFHDVTAQRELERQREDFLASASHDLKGPLSAIAAQAQLIQYRVSASTPDGERISRGAARIEQAAARMARLINELMDVARLRMGRPLTLDRKPTELVEIVRRMVTETTSTARLHQVELRVEVEPLVGVWDGFRVERILSNLLGNAVKYSPAGGEIVVVVGQREDDRGRWATVAVSDQGIGIPADDLPRLFQQYYRARNVVGKIGGEGIGLAGARQVAEQHGGTIEVESQEGRGSTFTLWLPLTDGSSGYDPAVKEVLDATS
jgi:PAS domain S-box-containing protein